MILNLILDDQIYELNAPEEFLRRAEDFFRKMDKDMESGWQMGREWVEKPDRLQRCKIAGDKLLTALENENHDLGRLMAGYILSRAPEITAIEPDINGEPQQTLFSFRDDSVEPSAGFAPTFGSPADAQVDPEAYTTAGKQVSDIFRVGRQWRFSILNLETGAWEESPAIGNQSQAEAMREAAVMTRYRKLRGDS